MSQVVPVLARLIFSDKTLFEIGFSGNNHPLKQTAHILLMEDQLQLKPLHDPKMTYDPHSWTQVQMFNATATHRKNHQLKSLIHESTASGSGSVTFSYKTSRQAVHILTW